MIRVVHSITIMHYLLKPTSLGVGFCFGVLYRKRQHSPNHDLYWRSKTSSMHIKPFKLERYYTLYEHSAKYSLCNSDCEAMTIKELLSLEAGAEDKFSNVWLGYTETKGNPELRREISRIYDNLNAEQVTVCSGAQEPIFLLAHALLEQGDEVVVQSPCYQSLHSVPESIGCKVSDWSISYKGDQLTYDLEELSSIVTSNTKAIFLNAPHNPTGFLFTKDEQQAIIELARANGTLIICDEVYREMEHRSEYLIPAFADAYELGVSIGVMSKSYGLPGLRIGWLATTQKSILEKVAVLKEYTTICNAAPSEFLASLALRNRKVILTRNLEIVRSNLTLYDDFFKKHHNLFSWSKPNAGPVALVKMLFSGDDMSFAQDVLKQQEVLLLPGGVYDYPGYFRIGFGRQGIPEALVQFEAYVEKHLVE